MTVHPVHTLCEILSIKYQLLRVTKLCLISHNIISHHHMFWSYSTSLNVFIFWLFNIRSVFFWRLHVHFRLLWSQTQKYPTFLGIQQGRGCVAVAHWSWTGVVDRWSPFHATVWTYLKPHFRMKTCYSRVSGITICPCLMMSVFFCLRHTHDG